MSKPFIGGFFMNRKIKTTIYVVSVLWIAVMSQLVVNRLFMDDARIMDAFIDTDTNIEESTLNLVVDYGSDFLLNNQKEEVLNNLADAVDLGGYRITKESINNTTTMKIEQKEKKKKTTVEFITVIQKEEQKTSYRHFVLLEMKMSDDYEEVIHYKKEVDSQVKKMKTEDFQCILKFTGSYDGKLTEKQRDKNVQELLKNLQAKKVDSISSEGYYTLYAYTGLVDDFIKADGKRINLNIVVSYDEEEDKTVFYLATPILNDEF